jgi:PPOX class probable F420-dependent enzyme
MKRIAANPRVTVAVCDVRGRIRSQTTNATAAILDPSIGPTVHKLLRAKHRLWKPMLDAWGAVNRRVRRKPRAQDAYIEIRLDPPSLA